MGKYLKNSSINGQTLDQVIRNLTTYNSVRNKNLSQIPQIVDNTLTVLSVRQCIKYLIHYCNNSNRAAHYLLHHHPLHAQLPLPHHHLLSHHHPQPHYIHCLTNINCLTTIRYLTAPPTSSVLFVQMHYYNNSMVLISMVVIYLFM